MIGTNEGEEKSVHTLPKLVNPCRAAMALAMSSPPSIWTAHWSVNVVDEDVIIESSSSFSSEEDLTEALTTKPISSHKAINVRPTVVVFISVKKRIKIKKVNKEIYKWWKKFSYFLISRIWGWAGTREVKTWFPQGYWAIESRPKPGLESLIGYRTQIFLYSIFLSQHTKSKNLGLYSLYFLASSLGATSFVFVFSTWSLGFISFFFLFCTSYSPWLPFLSLPTHIHSSFHHLFFYKGKERHSARFNQKKRRRNAITFSLL